MEFDESLPSSSVFYPHSEQSSLLGLHALQVKSILYNICLNTVLTKNKKGEVEYPAKFWDKISDKAKDLVQLLLKKNPKERISAEEALNHPWFN
jgi:serine/threonine protein kinase